MKFLERLLLLLFVFVQVLLTRQLILFQLMQSLRFLQHPFLFLLIHLHTMLQQTTIRPKVTGPEESCREMELSLILINKSTLSGE